MSDFEKFKRGITDDEKEKETPIITKEFDLKAGKSISFSGNERVDEKAFKEEQEEQFNHFKELMKSM